jgi:RNA polymerase sigma factor (sigma-70 family)
MDDAEVSEVGRAPVGPGDARRERIGLLLQAARAGQRDALAALVSELTPLLWHVARAQGLDQADAQDVVQTTWLHLLRELHDIRAPQALAGWLVTVCRREAIKVRSSRRTEAADVDFDAIETEQSGPAERVLTGARNRALWTAVTLLPDRCRELIRVVAFVDRPNYAAVSAAIGMPRGAIGPTRGRCLAKLRQILTDHPDWSWP